MRIAAKFWVGAIKSEHSSNVGLRKYCFDFDFQHNVGIYLPYTLENFESYRNLDCSISLKEPTSPLIKDSKLDLVKQIEELQAENLKLK